MKSLPILYHDDRLIAVNKPAGLLVHRSDIDRQETENAMHIVRDQLGQWVYPLHRLDRPTSGVLVFALDKETARSMMESFISGAVSKSYLAVVRGFTPEEGRIDHPLMDVWDKMTDQLADRRKPAREAITEYKRLATVELPYPVGRYATARYSLIEARPLTGRGHQIRRHLKHIFHPLIGDVTYGDGKHTEFFRKHFNCHRLLLHSHEIVFTHPCEDRKLRIHAPLDNSFGVVLEALHWDNVIVS